MPYPSCIFKRKLKGGLVRWNGKILRIRHIKIRALVVPLLSPTECTSIVAAAFYRFKTLIETYKVLGLVHSCWDRMGLPLT